MTDFSWGDVLHTRLLTPDRELRTDQSTDATKVQLGDAKSFVELLAGIWGEVTGVEQDSKTAASPKPLQHW